MTLTPQPKTSPQLVCPVHDESCVKCDACKHRGYCPECAKCYFPECPSNQPGFKPEF